MRPDEDVILDHNAPGNVTCGLDGYAVTDPAIADVAVRADGATGADDGPLMNKSQRTDAGGRTDCDLVLHFGET